MGNGTVSSPISGASSATRLAPASLDSQSPNTGGLRVPRSWRAWKRARGRPFNLTGWFASLSLLCILGVTVTSSIFLSRFLTQSLLERDALVTMEVVQSIIDVQDPHAKIFGGGADMSDRGLTEFFTHVAKLPDVLRANIYGQDQRVVWSSDPTLIGRSLGPNPELDRALAGGGAIVESGVISDKSPIKPEHILLRSDEPRFVELYLPVRAPRNGPVVGVVELYKVPVALFETIAQGLRMIWAFALGGGVLLYLTLFWVVGRAAGLIKEQSERLVESETLALVGEMTGAITHGIRNPLASIRTSAELVLDHPSAEVRESCRDVIAQVDRLSGWVHQLLTYADERPADVAPVELAALLQECLAGFSRELQRCGVSLTTAIEPALPRVRGERVRLGHVFNSILSNAIEAMPNGGSLRIEAMRVPRQRRVRVTIRDAGVGIPREHLERVFAPFFTTKRKGLGLGLPLVKRIVARFEGEVWIESDPDRGTAFHIELPLAGT